MPLDAATAALIGAGIGAVATLAGTSITASVTGKNSFRQHLYEKRLQVYEELMEASEKWVDPEYVNVDDGIHSLLARSALYAADSVTEAATDAHVAFVFNTPDRASETPNAEHEMELKQLVFRLRREIAGTSQNVPARRRFSRAFRY